MDGSSAHSPHPRSGEHGSTEWADHLFILPIRVLKNTDHRNGRIKSAHSPHPRSGEHGSPEWADHPFILPIRVLKNTDHRNGRMIRSFSPSALWSAPCGMSETTRRAHSSYGPSTVITATIRRGGQGFPHWLHQPQMPHTGAGDQQGSQLTEESQTS